MLWLHLKVLVRKKFFNLTKCVHFQNDNKWCGEWSKPCHMNAWPVGDLQKWLDHVWSCGACCWLDNYGLSCVQSSLFVKWQPHQFVTCSLKTLKLNKSCGQSLMRQCWSMGFQNWILKDSWLIVHKPIRTW